MTDSQIRIIVVDWLGPLYDAERSYGASNPDYVQPEEVDTLVAALITLQASGEQGPVSAGGFLGLRQL